jgi:hypothetical protein
MLPLGLVLAFLISSLALAQLTLLVLCRINDYKIDPNYRRINKYNEEVALETETKELIETVFTILKIIWVLRPLVGVTLSFGWFILGREQAIK